MTKLPSFNLTQVERTKHKLLNNAVNNSVETVPDLDSLAGNIAASMNIQFDTAYESVRYLSGRELTVTEADQLAWRLAGNSTRLRQGISVPPWSIQRTQEWVPLMVERLVKGRNSRNAMGYMGEFRVLAGTPAGMLIRHFWKHTAIGAVAMRVGFTRRGGKYPFLNSAAMVGLRMLGHLEPTRSRDAPGFFEVACSPSMVAWNRKNVLKLRLRVDRTRCPREYTHACWNCAVGYEECVAGTHRLNYQVGACEGCGMERAAFDPEDPGEFCVACSAANRMKVHS